ncbi:hypothetical protein N656DRAFT_715576 [Canariomyces notabilis]|uniref:Uncharacterized protein n=1 Tax=Canariomyces notabilis TaxID=2074819 RepID=A0AAN6QMQ7_9PEZI|nr:hypothetical protein N656DRAFT_715576 [Canariomyces arenarius]
MYVLKGIDADDQQQRDDEATKTVRDILAEIDPTTEILHIDEDTPSAGEWEELGRHFTHLRALHVDTGFCEYWIDENFPLHWPLELLVIASACGETITSPAILEGRIEHLVLLLTCGLRFEGPTSREMMKSAESIFIARDDDKEDAGKEGDSEDSGGLKIYSIPDEWRKWHHQKYGSQQIIDLFSGADDTSGPPSKMTKLEIIGNDAIETLTRMALAHFHLLTGLSSLTLCSIHDNDLAILPGDYFATFLPMLSRLKELRLTVDDNTLSALHQAISKTRRSGSGSGTHDNDTKSHHFGFLHDCLPPNLEALHFRGPVTLAPKLGAFTAALSDPACLPSLRRMSFVLDLPCRVLGNGNLTAPLKQLRAARRACRTLWDAAARRGVVVEDRWWDPWVEVYKLPHIPAVDGRWEECGLDDD